MKTKSFGLKSCSPPSGMLLSGQKVTDYLFYVFCLTENTVSKVQYMFTEIRSQILILQNDERTLTKALFLGSMKISHSCSDPPDW